MRDKSYHYWMRKEVQRLFPHSQAVVVVRNVEGEEFWLRREHYVEECSSRNEGENKIHNTSKVE